MKSVKPAEYHGAKFSDEILATFVEILGREMWTRTILDPFAGSGRIHELAVPCNAWTFGVEIEPEFAAMHPQTFVGDSTKLHELFDEETIDWVVTSPCYGNRMADNDMRESCAGTYAKWLGRKPSENSAGGMQWGERYRDLHEQVWRQCYRVVKHGGGLLLNFKDHFRDKRLQHVSLWHLQTLTDLGFEWHAVHTMKAAGLRYGRNGESRTSTEWIFVLRKP